jgi:hypothetical protein
VATVLWPRHQKLTAIAITTRREQHIFYLYRVFFLTPVQITTFVPVGGTNRYKCPLTGPQLHGLPPIILISSYSHLSFLPLGIWIGPASRGLPGGKGMLSSHTCRHRIRHRPLCLLLRCALSCHHYNLSLIFSDVHCKHTMENISLRKHAEISNQTWITIFTRPTKLGA